MLFIGILYNYNSIDNNTTDTSISTPVCTVQAGPTVPLPGSIMEIFRLLFTPTLILMIVEQTNLYVSQVMTEEAYAKFVPVTQAEIEAYMGFMILMGINQLPSLYHYWKRDPQFHYSPIADRITRDRFLEISRYLHFTNNSMYNLQRTDEQYDKIWKVRPIVNALHDSFLQNYNPHNAVSIDEAMIPFKGRSTLKQYLPKKPTKRGIKVWVRADAKNGYVSEFQVYLGKPSTGREKKVGERVVIDLTRALMGHNNTVYCDNYFTTVSLFDNLLKDKIYACGTMRSDRIGYPPELKKYVKKGLPNRGDYKQTTKDGILFSLWQDTKVVNVISTNCEMGMV